MRRDKWWTVARVASMIIRHVELTLNVAEPRIKLVMDGGHVVVEDEDVLRQLREVPAVAFASALEHAQAVVDEDVLLLPLSVADRRDDTIEARLIHVLDLHKFGYMNAVACASRQGCSAHSSPLIS